MVYVCFVALLDESVYIIRKMRVSFVPLIHRDKVSIYQGQSITEPFVEVLKFGIQIAHFDT